MLLNLVERGAGEPVVLIHGAGTSSEIWRLTLPLLAVGRHAVAIDIPGYGASPPIGRAFDFGDVADRVVVGLAKAGVEAPYDVVGHSLGGALATVLAGRHAARVRRLVLVAPAGLAAAPPGVARLLRAAAEPFARARRSLAIPLADSPTARRIALAGVAHDGARVSAYDARAVLRSSLGARRLGPGLAAAAGADLTAELAALRIPVGFVWGEHDRVVPASRIAQVRALRPGAPVAVVKDGAHAPMLEHPRAFVDALEEVLAALQPR